MAIRLNKNTIVVFGQENTYGQGASFNYTDGSLKIESGTLTLPHDTTNYTPLRKEFGVADIYNTGLHAQLEFELALHGEGMDGSNVKETRIGKLLQACLLKKSTLEDADLNIIGYQYDTSNGEVGYDTDFPSLAFEVYVAGDSTNADKYTLVGCVGSFRFTGTVGRYPTLAFTFLGKLSGNPTTTTLPAVTYSDIKPYPLEGVNFSFAGQSVCVNEVSIELGNKLATRPCLTDENGIAGTIINGRETTGSIDPEAIFESDLSIFQKMVNADTVSISLIIGTEQGNKVTISSDTVKIRDFRYADRDGIATQDIDLAFIQPDGGSELIIKFE